MKKLSLIILFSVITFGAICQTTANTNLQGTLVSKAPDATTVTYKWSKIAGPTAGTITTPNSLSTTVTGLENGIYQFELAGTDNFGLTGKDTVQVTVVRANIAPKVNAGQDIIIQLGQTSFAPAKKEELTVLK